MSKQAKRYLYWTISFGALVLYGVLYFLSNVSFEEYNQSLWNEWMRLWSPTNDKVLNVIINFGLVISTVILGIGMLAWYMYLLLRIILISLPFFLLLFYISILFWLGSLSPTGLVVAWVIAILSIIFLFSRRKLFMAGLKSLFMLNPWKDDKKRVSYQSSDNGSDSWSNDAGSSYGDEVKQGGFPSISKGATSSREKTGWFGDKYYEDDRGVKTYQRTGWLGDKYYENDEGVKTYEKTDWLGGKYTENSEGQRSEEKTDWLGGKYYQESDGSIVREKTDWLGNKYYEKD